VTPIVTHADRPFIMETTNTEQTMNSDQIGGARGGAPDSGTTDAPTDKRVVQPTEKYIGYQVALYTTSFKKAVSSWRYCQGVMQTMLADCSSPTELRKARDNLQELLNNALRESDKLKDLGAIHVVDELIDIVLHEHTSEMKSVNTRIRELESDTKSIKSASSVKTASSKKSKGSNSSNYSLVQASVQAAALKAKLKYVDLENEKRSEMIKLQTIRDLSVAEAKIQAFVDYQRGEEFSVLEEESVLPPDIIDRESYVEQYLSELSLDGHPQARQNPSELRPAASEFRPRQVLYTGERPYAPVSQPVLHTGDQPYAPVYQPVLPTGDKPYVPVYQQQVLDLTYLVGLGRLPTPEPGVFDGDPLIYPGWKAGFETLIESRGIPDMEKMYYLKKYLVGPAKEAVEG
jgi:hypothetical protein